MEAGTAQPNAVASIELTDEQRERIASELKLDEAPRTIDIARFEEADADDVAGFLLLPAVQAAREAARTQQPTTYQPRPNGIIAILIG